MNQEQTSSQKQEEPQPQPHHSREEQEFSQIEDGQVENAIKILKKLKMIEKTGKLNHFKHQSKKNNALFHHMSEFFHRKHKKKISEKVKKITERKIISQRRFQSAINSKTTTILQSLQEQKNQALPLPQQQVDPLIQQQSQQYPKTNQPISCHICCFPYTQIHPFYGYLCPSCASLNMQKRTQRCNMSHLTALVTGARIKIGYQITLKLLREGAKVYATSRFPNDTLLRYKSQKDYEQWKDNLYIIQCDFLSQTQVTSLITYIKQNVRKLDILINNAAQTIVRPKQFYTHELKNENLSIQDQKNKPITYALSTIIQNDNQMDRFPSLHANTISILPSQIDIQNTDQFGQPIDKRANNTWIQKIQDVSLMDCYTTQVINSIVPFHLISQLKQTMIGDTPSWVINVSSMEGVFYRANKSFHHPHTNMAKAALNMITRTSAPQFKDHGIFMNSVDTGWVTNQNPYPIAQKMQQQHKFKCPLDCVDGAMRVLDPIYQGLLSNTYPYGQFIKNYKESTW